MQKADFLKTLLKHSKTQVSDFIIVSFLPYMQPFQVFCSFQIKAIYKEEGVGEGANREPIWKLISNSETPALFEPHCEKTCLWGV